MKIAMINGSPRQGKSNSAILLRAIEPLVSQGNEISHYNISREPLAGGQYGELCHMDVLVFAFPLYVDALPSHFFKMLVDLEGYMKAERKKDIYVCALINNGFYEGKQCHIAFEILQNWCSRSGLIFGQGIGQGAGEMLDFTEKVPLGHGPLKNLGIAMKSVADNIKSGGTGDPIMISPNFPRFAWKFSATHAFWNAMAKKNGLKKKDILKKSL